MKRKTRKTRWEKKLETVVDRLEKQGHPVKFVTHKVLKDYGGMNSAAAKEMGFKWDKKFSRKGYLISATSEPETQCKDLIHEHTEYLLMTKKRKPYWHSHCLALKKEKSVKC